MYRHITQTYIVNKDFYSGCLAFSFNRPVGAQADVVHVELDGFRLLFVFKVVVCQKVVQLIHHRGRWGSSFRECRHLKHQQTIMQIYSNISKTTEYSEAHTLTAPPSM